VLGAEILGLEAHWPETVQAEALELVQKNKKKRKNKKKGTVRTILSFTDTDERFYAAGEVALSY
jgi:hypothetical protein